MATILVVNDERLIGDLLRAVPPLRPQGWR